MLYTDGITEAMDRTRRAVRRRRRWRASSGSHRGLDAAGIRERVLREVKAFVGDAEPHDDMTMVVMKVDGGPAVKTMPSPGASPAEVLRTPSSIEAEVVCALLDAHDIEAAVSSALRRAAADAIRTDRVPDQRARGDPRRAPAI